MDAFVVCEGFDADTLGPIIVEWFGTMECDDCYATAP